MMGRPHSLEEMLKQTKNETIELIAGNTRVDPRDVVPTGMDDIFEIQHRPVPNGIFISDPSVAAWRYSDSVTMTIPETYEELRHEGINYYDDEEFPLAMNEVEVPDSELKAFNDSVSNKLPAFKDLFYATAANLSALSDASEYVEAALRSGLDVDLEMDGALLSAFVPISRLDAIATIVKKTGMPQTVQDAYLLKITELLAEKTMDAITNYDAGIVKRRQMEVLREANHARVRSTDSAPQTPAQSTAWGLTGSRK